MSTMMCGRVSGVGIGQITVTVERSEACKNCGACRFGSDKSTEMVFPYDGEARVGDKAYFDTETKKGAYAAAIIYLIPLVALIIGIIAGLLIFSSSRDPGIYGVLTGILFTAAAFSVIMIFDRRGAFLHAAPQVVRIEHADAADDADSNTVTKGDNNDGR